MKGLIKNSIKEIKTRNFWLTLLLDMLFIICALVLSSLATWLLSSIYKGTANISIALIFLLYSLMLIAVYNFFKLKIIGLLHKNLKEEKIKHSQINFYVFNIILAIIILFAVFIASLLVNYFVKPEFQSPYYIITFSILSIIFYILINILQVLNVLKKPVENAPIIIGKNFLSYLLVFLMELGGLIIFYIIYFGIYSLAKGKANIAPLFQFLTILILIFYNAFNRVVFFRSIK
jgi:hypothetical protein